MERIAALWKANTIAFISSFCVMVIELVAARILAPHIGVSLYTWTSIIGVILAGIALGNFVGGKVADRYPSPLLLTIIFFVGSLATVAILPFTHLVASADWLSGLPVMPRFTLITFFIFFIPAVILSMVSPMVIKLTLANLGRTGGVVGTIYACSTAGSILGTFMTGFYLIFWFGTAMVVWLVVGILILTGIIAWLCYGRPLRWRLSLRNFIILIAIIELFVVQGFLFQHRDSFQKTYTKESNYYSIQVLQGGKNVKVLILDDLIHSYVNPDDPTVLVYHCVNIFEEVIRYFAQENSTPRVLHLGGGGYTMPRYLEAVYPGSVNDVVEIDPAVTQVVYEELGLPLDTTITTYNQDARLFLIDREPVDKYDIVIGDVFNDKSTPYHLTTLEFNELVKSHMAKDGIYMVNVIDDYERGRYMPSIIYTLRQTFENVYLLDVGEDLPESGIGTFIIAATDRHIDVVEYKKFITNNGQNKCMGNLNDEAMLDAYLSERNPILLTDDYAPTDILVAPIFQ